MHVCVVCESFIVVKAGYHHHRWISGASMYFYYGETVSFRLFNAPLAKVLPKRARAFSGESRIKHYVHTRLRLNTKGGLCMYVI